MIATTGIKYVVKPANKGPFTFIRYIKIEYGNPVHITPNKIIETEAITYFNKSSACLRAAELSPNILAISVFCLLLDNFSI